jgi:hypothetical protein
MKLTRRGETVIAIGFGILATVAILLTGWIEAG